MPTCQHELKTKLCGKEMFIIYNNIVFCKNHFDKINNNLCTSNLKNGDLCGKKASYTKDNEHFYCKIHFDKLNKPKTPTCSYILKTGNECGANANYTDDDRTFLCKRHYDKKHEVKCTNCDKRATCAKDGINYCKVHFDKMNEKLCKGKLANGSSCTKKASYIKNGIDYCKVHFDKSNEHLCDSVINNKKCNKKAVGKTSNKYYCNDHQPVTKTDRSNNTISRSPVLEILDKINDIKKITLTQKNKTTIKKDIFRILLQIHPDKCTIEGFNAKKYTQELNTILERIKAM